MMTISGLASLAILTGFATGLAGCMHAEDPVTQYIQRSDKITLSAGNAKDANAAIHINDPWPRASANRRIPANGERMARAHERYREGKPSPSATINPPTLGGAGGGAGGAAASGAASPR